MAPKKTSSSQSNTLGSGFPSSKASASAAPSQKATKKASAKPKGDHDGDLQLDGYPELYREAKSKMGKPTHDGQGMDPIITILRVFDCSEEYGPASKISRLERYERAERLGLDPPKEIGEILRTRTAKTRPEYRDSTFQI